MCLSLSLSVSISVSLLLLASSLRGLQDHREWPRRVAFPLFRAISRYYLHSLVISRRSHIEQSRRNPTRFVVIPLSICRDDKRLSFPVLPARRVYRLNTRARFTLAGAAGRPRIYEGRPIEITALAPRSGITTSAARSRDHSHERPPSWIIKGARGRPGRATPIGGNENRVGPDRGET